MNMQTNKPLHLPLLVGGIAAILVSGIAIASLTISTRGSNGVVAPTKAAEAVVVPALAAPVTRSYWCSECGVIESAREIEVADEKTGAKSSGPMPAGNRGGIAARPFRNYEITVRMQNGSMRVIKDPKPARWRQGERVTVIAGVDQ
jgi:hypothetical protein